MPKIQNWGLLCLLQICASKGMKKHPWMSLFRVQFLQLIQTYCLEWTVLNCEYIHLRGSTEPDRRELPGPNHCMQLTGLFSIITNSVLNSYHNFSTTSIYEYWKNKQTCSRPVIQSPARKKG